LTSPRLLQRLEAAIAAASSPVQADGLRADRAACLARLGRYAEARAEIDALHTKYALSPQASVSGWCHLAEGLLDYFSSQSGHAGDHVQRAHALGVAAGQRGLQAVCAAWLAQWEYGGIDPEAMTRHVGEALQVADPQHHAARSRACLVVAQGSHLAARLDLAQPWYRRARDHATADSDDVTLSALSHNMAWLHMLNLRQLVLTGQSQGGSGRHALLSAESNAHLDALLGDSSWQPLKPILRAQIVSLQGDTAQALALYDQHLTDGQVVARLDANLWADRAWCQACHGLPDAARASAQQARDSVSADTQIDDRAATHSRLAQAYRQLGDEALAAEQAALAAEVWSRFVEIQGRYVALLSSLDSDTGTTRTKPSP
jgi:tetratricopeptide (TPR) repeat protein